MPEDNIMLDTIYKNWEKYQNGLIEALSPLTAEQLALRAAPNLRSVGELATHIVSCRAGWFHSVLHEGGDELAAIDIWDSPHHPGQPNRTADELVAALHTTWAAIQEALDRWTPEDLAAPIHHVWDDGEQSTVYRPYVIWHLIEHDVHHGGEIGYSLGMHGLAAPDI
ncbi:MAG: DinB family protein [Chloroflexia bacterium]